MATAEEKKNKKQFNESTLNDEQKELFKYAKRRIKEMQSFREQEHYGVELNKLWADADRAYIPHRITSAGKRVLVEDEDKGWRSSLVRLGDAQWQSDIAQANPFVKITVALATLVDQNPSGTFTATKKAFQATTLLIEKLYQRSWEVARSKGQLKLFVHNLAKYGWSCARTYPLRIERKVRVLTTYNSEDPSKSVHEEKTVVEYNDVMRETLDPRNVWIDDMARPNSQFSMRDWCWRKVYSMDMAKEEFGNYPFWDKFVTAGGTLEETISETKNDGAEKGTDKKDLIEIYFYENRLRDIFMVIANGVPVVIEPLPISDEQGVKKLSLWQTYWQLRHAMSPYGIGIYEAIRFDQSFLDRIRNMTIDQLTLSIYKMFFYQGTQSLTDTGDIKISPGVGKQVLNPKDMKWLEIPGPGKDAYEGIKMFKEDVDEASGITEPLLGEVTGKTAFELAQAKEAAVKRLKVPLDNILEALNDEGYITVYLIQLLYSIPETYEIADRQLIEDYLREIGGDQDLFERKPKLEGGEPVLGEDGQPETTFTAKVYPEFPLNLDKDERGNLLETSETKFFRTKPKSLKWEGIINMKAQSLLSPSKQIDKALSLEMYNMLIPLFAQPPQLYKKAAEDIVKQYDKDPREVLPDAWLALDQEQQNPSLFVDQQQQAGQEGVPTPQTGAQRVTAQPTLPQQPAGAGGGLISKLISKIR